MWATFVLDIYRDTDRRDVFDALRTLLEPGTGSAFSSGGVYVFWDPYSREPLYVGIATDLALRFAQHNGLKSSPAGGCKREQINEFIAANGAIGFTVLLLSSLSPTDSAAERKALGLTDPLAIEQYEALVRETDDEMRALEGRLIASNVQRFGRPPRWNVSPGRIPRSRETSGSDATLAIAVGAVDTLLQSRRTIRELAADSEAIIFEEHLHGIRLVPVAIAIRSGKGFRSEMIREYLEPMAKTPTTALIDKGRP